MPSFNLSAWAVKHPSFVLYLIVVSIVAGVYSFFSMGRAEDPSFTIKTMTIGAIWPGASSEDVQRMVADRIEKKLQDLPQFDFAKTYSRPGACAILVNLKDTTRGEQVKELWYQARKKIADMKGELPEGVLGPYFNDEFGDVYSALYAMTGPDFTLAELKTIAETLRQDLLRLPDVKKVNIIGHRPEKIFIEFSHSKLASLGIHPQQIFESVAKQNAIQPAGSIDTQTDRIFLRVEGTFDAVEQVSQVPIQADGRILKLSDIATIRRDVEEPAKYSMRFGGQPAIGLGVVMSDGGNVLALGERLREHVGQFPSDLPAGIQFHTLSFQPEVVAESVDEFQRSFLEALGIVLFVSFLSLGFRTGIVVAMCVPLVLAITIVIMYTLGMNLDRITLGSLIIALGLLVDDAIIAVEMMIVKMEQGMSRLQAATFAWTSTAFPMLTGTLVTAIGFVPVGFAKSAAGEYAGGIFWVVGIALMVSWIVAVFFTPFLGFKFLPNPKHDPAHHDVYDTRFYQFARRTLDRCLRHPRTILALTASLFIASMLSFTLVKQQFFPQSSRTEVLVELRLPEGSSFAATENSVQRLEKILLEDPEVEYFTAYSGDGPPRFFLSLDPDLPAPNFAKFVIMTGSQEHRESLVRRLRQRFADGIDFPELRGRVTRLDFGPPVGYPIQFRVAGTDPDQLRTIAYQLRTKLQQFPETRDVNLEWNERSKAIDLQIDQDRARLLGLTPQEISLQLQTLLSGVTISQFREGIESIDVVARGIPEERLDVGSLDNVSLTTTNGKVIPLSQIATLKPSQEEPVLWRRNRDLVLTVRSDVAEGLQPQDVTNRLLPEVMAMNQSLPPGYRIEVGGSAEEAKKANSSIFAVFPVMVFLMLTVLMVQVQHIRKMLLVVLIAPLGLIGVTYALLLFDAPFGFVALLGVISLAGMDMRNSVILMDQIEQDLADGATPWDAVVGATIRRARPVILTAATAILAMIPLSHSVFWGPMAIAIMGGLSIATFLTLVNLPALYILWFGVRPDPAPVAIPATSTTQPASQSLVLQ